MIYIDKYGNEVMVDVDNLSYSELIKLKEDVSGLPIYSVICGIINDKVESNTLRRKVSCYDTGIKKFK